MWDDGHKWCFGCGYYVQRNGLEQVQELERKINNKNKELKRNHVTLPSDFTYNLPCIAKSWLNNYGITKKELIDNHIGWSENDTQLIYPCFDVCGNLLMYQGRKFNDGILHGNRFHTHGPCEKIYHILGDLGDGRRRIVLVEDMVSCIKVARTMPCLVLFGSTIATERLINLSNKFTNLIIWLDKDKAKYAVARSQIAKFMFDSVRVVITEKDPKRYTEAHFETVASALKALPPTPPPDDHIPPNVDDSSAPWNQGTQ